jgi:hypothetical protein
LLRVEIKETKKVMNLFFFIHSFLFFYTYENFEERDGSTHLVAAVPAVADTAVPGPLVK